MISETVVELSRWQFAITAILHFLFIPLTLGLGLLLALMETAFVVTGRAVYKAMAQVWGRIFAINFVLAISTRLVVLFQFGMSGSYFSHFAGDVFALPLAIEAISSFFVATALFGPYWFGRERLGKFHYLLLIWLIAVAVNLSAYWVMIANGWMQNPMAASFNYQSYRLELTSLTSLLTNPAAITKYLHTLLASYVAAAAVLMAICAYWLRSNPNDQLAQSSFKLCSGMGMLAILITISLGDDTPNLKTPVQQAKLATIHGDAYTSLLPGIESQIRSGIQAYAELQELRDGKQDAQLLAGFEQHKSDLGYALLLTPWNKQIVNATDQQITQAAKSALPAYPGLVYWSYRIMIACGIISLLLFLSACWTGFFQKTINRWMLDFSMYLAPIPWLACLCGWFVAEVGKQPWAIAGVLPTFMSVSSLSVSQLIISAVGFGLAHLILFTAGLFLMQKTLASRHVLTGEQ